MTKAHPNAGKRPCMRCQKLFKSWNTTLNRICGPCSRKNALLTRTALNIIGCSYGYGNH